MYHEFFGIAESPFSITPDPRYLFMSKGHQEALAHLLYGVSESGGFVLLTGEVGTGKTSVCRCLLEQLPDAADVALILNPRLNEIELLAAICDELGVAYPAEDKSLKRYVDRLNAHLLQLHAEGRHGVVIIDEAQNLSPDVLEQVRLLTNLETATRKLLQIILIGQPELHDLLARREMRQLAQRITARYHLEPLSRAETLAYIEHRLAVGGLAPGLFSARAAAAVYRRSHGVPRLINSLCDRCLLGAYSQNRKNVAPNLVRQAATEVLGRKPPRSRSAAVALPLLSAAAVTALVAAVLLGFGFVDLPPLEIAAPGSGDTPRVSSNAAGPAASSEPAVAEDEPAAASTDAAAVEEMASRAPEPEIGPAGDGDDNDKAPDTVATEGPELGKEAAVAQPSASAPKFEGSHELGPSVALVQLSAGAPVGRETQADVPAGGDSAHALAPGFGSPATSPIPEPAVQSAAIAGPVEVSTIQILLGRGDADFDNKLTTAALFDLWGLARGPGDQPVSCDQPLGAGIKCLRGKVAWDTLLSLNRPALIMLRRSEGENAAALISAVDGEYVALTMGSDRLVARAEEITGLWTGEFLILWRPPVEYDRVLARGAIGKDVAWLKARLADINDEPALRAGRPVFDSKLHNAVVAFQESRGLEPDGIVGTQTVIHLNTAAKSPDGPVLRAAIR